MTARSMAGIEYRISGFSSYEVWLDDVLLGEVERDIRRKGAWSFKRGQAFGTVTTREQAAAALMELGS